MASDLCQYRDTDYFFNSTMASACDRWMDGCYASRTSRQTLCRMCDTYPHHVDEFSELFPSSSPTRHCSSFSLGRSHAKTLYSVSCRRSVNGQTWNTSCATTLPSRCATTRSDTSSMVGSPGPRGAGVAMAGVAPVIESCYSVLGTVRVELAT